MKELTLQDVHDYANEFNALISTWRLEMNLDGYFLKMTDQYLCNKYPEKHDEIKYPEWFAYKRLQKIIDYFNKQTNKTKILIQRLLSIVGEIIYGDHNRFIYAI